MSTERARSELGPDGRPVDPSYLERDLPPILAQSLAAIKAAYARIERGESSPQFDECSAHTRDFSHELAERAYAQHVIKVSSSGL